MSAIDLIILDGQGVVFNRPLPDFLTRLALETDQEASHVERRWKRELRIPFWIGMIDEAEVWEALAPGRPPADWSERLEAAYELGPGAAALERWAKARPLWMLSNHRAHRLRRRLDAFGLTDRFERVLVSDELGFAKPDRRLFEIALRRSGRRAAHVLYVDDQRPNVEAAASLGMQTIEASGDPDAWTSRVDELLAAS